MDETMGHQEPLRILYSFPHRVGAPGIGTTAINQVRALAQLGATVSLWCTSVHGELPDSVDVHETLRVAGRRVPHRAFGNPDRALAYHDWRVGGHLRTAGREYDVVHAWPQSAVATYRAAASMGVLSSREVPNTHTANAYTEAAREWGIVGLALGKDHAHRSNRRHLVLEDLEYALADLLLVPSEHVEQTFLDRGIPASKLRRHQYGFDTSRFNAAGRTEMPDRPFSAAFVGSAEPRKGLHYALEAWNGADLPANARLVIAGSFVTGYREYLADQLGRPGIEERGFVADVPRLLRDSDVLLLPSIEEGSALVTYEAQASGVIPLVSSAAGALLPPEVVDAVVHPPRDAPTLRDQITLIARDASHRSELRRAVTGWSHHLTWRAAGRRMLEIYAEALQSRATASTQRAAAG